MLVETARMSVAGQGGTRGNVRVRVCGGGAVEAACP